MSEDHTAAIDARPACRCAPDCAERIACVRVGEVGHFACGWCEGHGQANHICLCLAVQGGHVLPPARGE